MTYVISDILGHFDEYEKMLEMVKFSDWDTLYVLGNVIDGSLNSKKLLRDMMYRINVIPMLAVREYVAVKLMREMLSGAGNKTGYNRWLDEWKGMDNNTALFEDEKDIFELLDYLEEFSLYEEVKVGENEFVLVHAGLNNFSPEKQLSDYSIGELLFGENDSCERYYPDKYIVTGDIPTRYMGDGLDVIVRNDRHFNINCGVDLDGRLALLCLENMQEFYV